MTVTSQTDKVTANGNGVATTFSFSPVVITQASDMTVYLLDNLGNQTQLALGTGPANFSINLGTNTYPCTGSVVYPAAGSVGGTILPTGWSITMKRAVTIQQTMALTNQGGWFPEVQEAAFDYLTYVCLDLQEQVSRCLSIGVTASAASLATLGADLTAVAADLTNINTVAGAITNVNAVGADVANINACAADLTAINAAPTYATNAANSATAAAASAASFSGDAGLAALRAERANKVVMVHDASSATWTVYKPDGTVLSTTGTTTQGLQEAINYAATNGFPLQVSGGAIITGGTVDNARITCTTALNIPTADKGSYNFDAVTLLLNPSPASNDGMVFDSFDMMDFRFRGQILYTGTGACVRLLPVNNNGESFIGGTSSLFDIGSIVCVVSGANLAPDATKGICLHISETNGVITNNRFLIGEMNAGQVGVQIDNPAAGKSFNLNEIDCPAIHSQSAACVQIGTSATSGLISGNQWRVNCTPTGASAQGIATWGQLDQFIASIQGGNIGINLNVSAAQNSFVIARNTATTPVSDTSTTKDSAGIYGDWYPAASVNLNGVNQTAIVTATATKVQFSTKDYDNGGKFDAVTNFRWTPGRPGIAHIAARVSWNTMADAVPMAVIVYKNGAEFRRGEVMSSGTVGGGGQGATISVDVPVTAATDYFEIFAYQQSGGNLDISGQSSETWATFRMVRS